MVTQAPAGASRAARHLTRHGRLWLLTYLSSGLEYMYITRWQLEWLLQMDYCHRRQLEWVSIMLYIDGRHLTLACLMQQLDDWQRR